MPHEASPREIIASSKRFSVSGWSGALMVTTSQNGTISPAVGWKVRASSFSMAAGRRCRSV
jgi:hypothetical protein